MTSVDHKQTISRTMKIWFKDYQKFSIKQVDSHLFYSIYGSGNFDFKFNVQEQGYVLVSHLFIGSLQKQFFLVSQFLSQARLKLKLGTWLISQCIQSHPPCQGQAENPQSFSFLTVISPLSGTILRNKFQLGLGLAHESTKHIEPSTVETAPCKLGCTCVWTRR